jgi:type I restriction enzyme R subunit
MSGEAREKFAGFIEDGDIRKFTDRLSDLIQNDFTETMKILRNRTFQELLVNYPRAKRSFMVGYEAEDDVSSEVAFRKGSEYQKPEDYLDAFARFVRENPEQIEAIRILLERPKEWRTDVLEELKQKLAREDFSEKTLQRAHQLVYKKTLADIISMVKHGAREEAPLLNAEERVDMAMARVMEGKTFNKEQQQWLGMIREHMVSNLTIEMNHFDYAPIFERKGGLSKARRIFVDKLEALVVDLNYAVAA